MIVLIAGALAFATLLLVLAVLRDAHDAGVDRLHRAGEPVPWWIPHHLDDCADCYRNAR